MYFSVRSTTNNNNNSYTRIDLSLEIGAAMLYVSHLELPSEILYCGRIDTTGSSGYVILPHSATASNSLFIRVIGKDANRISQATLLIKEIEIDSK